MDGMGIEIPRSLAFYMKRLLMDGLPCIALALPDALSHEFFLKIHTVHPFLVGGFNPFEKY